MSQAGAAGPGRQKRMKALIISDIHSNIFALEAIWQREHDCDVVFCAGDLVDYGPSPGEVIAWVQAHGVACVQGNHDRAAPQNQTWLLAATGRNHI